MQCIVMYEILERSLGRQEMRQIGKAGI